MTRALKPPSPLSNNSYVRPLRKWKPSTRVSSNSKSRKTKTAIIAASRLPQTNSSGCVLHVDETGMRINTTLHGFHTASTAMLTFYAPHAKRGDQALRDMAILPGFTGRTGFSPQERARYEAVYARLIALGQQQNPACVPSGKRGRTRQSAAYNLLARLDKYRVWVLAFAWDFSVPFNNNQAERDLRMVKLRQKISGCFRSTEGASWFCRIRGYISTLRKQGISVLTALTSVFEGKPLMPKLVPG